MSRKDSQRRDPTAEIHAASLGELQLSLGKTAPPRAEMDWLTADSRSGNDGASESESVSEKWELLEDLGRRKGGGGSLGLGLGFGDSPRM